VQAQRVGWCALVVARRLHGFLEADREVEELGVGGVRLHVELDRRDGLAALEPVAAVLPAHGLLGALDAVHVLGGAQQADLDVLAVVVVGVVDRGVRLHRFALDRPRAPGPGAARRHRRRARVQRVAHDPVAEAQRSGAHDVGLALERGVVVARRSLELGHRPNPSLELLGHVPRLVGEVALLARREVDVGAACVRQRIDGPWQRRAAMDPGGREVHAGERLDTGAQAVRERGRRACGCGVRGC
jgi:hypothetical protein